ncbi:MAG: rhodanese-like domain-containing protein [Nitrospinota bacterium]|nr:rhodanese-like domain-containing protein [Nitrospinota bacterium]
MGRNYFGSFHVHPAHFAKFPRFHTPLRRQAHQPVARSKHTDRLLLRMKKGLRAILSRPIPLWTRARRLPLLFPLLFFVLALLPETSYALSLGSSENVKSAAREGALLLDVRGYGEFSKGHIPGAVNAPFFELMDSTQHLYPPDEIAAILGDYGVGRDMTVIVHGERGSMFASYMGWVLEYLGSKNVLVYTGGIEDWQEIGGILSTDTIEAEPADFEPELRENMRVDAEFLKQNAGSGKIAVVDSRSDREFLGQDIRALRGGHIPGAINIDWMLTINPQTGDLAPVKRLNQLFASVPKDKPVVVYCQTGARASMALLAMKAAGFSDVRLYPESWKDWGSNLSLPVEGQTFFDFFGAQMKMNDITAENNRLKAEQKAISDASNVNTLFLLFGAITVYAGFIVLLGRKDHSMTTATWILIAVLTLFSGYLFGYVVSTKTGIQSLSEEIGQAETGGYGK